MAIARRAKPNCAAQTSYTTEANIDALLATIADPAQYPALRRTFVTNQDTTGVGALLAMVGAYRQAIALLLDDSIPADDLGQEFLWMPVARNIIEQPEYIALAERDGQMAWWRARGFPAGCRVVEAAPAHIDCSERWRAEVASR